MHDDLKAKLEPYFPIRMVVRIHEGKVQGKVEHSFSMDWDDGHVNVFWSGKAFSMLGEHQLNGEKWAKGNLNQWKTEEFLIDPLAEDSPIEVDWEKWIASTDKFNKRNAHFTVKPHGTWQLRAMAAERMYNELKPRFANVCTRNNELDDQLDKVRAIVNPPETEE